MSDLQIQALQYMQCIPQMTDEQLSKLIAFFRNTVAPSIVEPIAEKRIPEKKGIKIGLFQGTPYLAEGHDFDEANDEIAELFGVEN